ncbi:MAG: J domain-containing protein [Spirochaetales bacterium]|nr:J domain-containing protein [Spirochaetales bacterium]
MTLTAEEQRAFFLLMGIPGQGVDLCDEDSLKKAFRSKAKKSHPDLAARMGKDPRLMKLRFQELNDAFNILMERVRKEAPGGQSAGTTGTATSASAAAAGSTAAGAAAAAEAAEASGTAEPRRKSGKKTGTSANRRPARTAETRKKPEKDIFYKGKLPARHLRFAEYLYYSGNISWTDLVQALVWQYRNRPKLGELAMETGYLDFAEVLEIIRQKNPDELFGEAAVRLGYITSSRLNSLVQEQKRMNLPIGNYFTSKRKMNEETLNRKLAELRRHNITSGRSGS